MSSNFLVWLQSTFITFLYHFVGFAHQIPEQMPWLGKDRQKNSSAIPPKKQSYFPKGSTSASWGQPKFRLGIQYLDVYPLFLGGPQGGELTRLVCFSGGGNLQHSWARHSLAPGVYVWNAEPVEFWWLAFAKKKLSATMPPTKCTTIKTT